MTKLRKLHNPHNPLEITLDYGLKKDPKNPGKGKWEKIGENIPTSSIRSWLQLFRAQTAPLSIIIVLAAYLNGAWEPLMAIFLIIIVGLSHFASYGHNSLMDTIMGYDTKDPSKQHHPLISGVISLTAGHHVIHLGLIILTLITILVTINISPAPLAALVCLIMWVIFGQAYNDGLSKESLLAAPIISLMTCSMVAWGWLLSHSEITPICIFYLIYVFLLIMFQISWDGSLKDLRMPEKSNLLVKMGVEIKKKQIKTYSLLNNKKYVVHMVDYIVIPPKATMYAVTLKMLSLSTILMIVVVVPFIPWLTWLILTIWITSVFMASFYFWRDLILNRVWDHESLLRDMSLEQICAIYLPIPLLVHPILAVLLMIGGIIYFWGMNRFLWSSTFFPKV